MIRNLDNFIGYIPLCVFCIVLSVLVILLNAKHLFSSKVSDKVGTGYIILWIVFTFYSCFYCPPGGDNFSSMNNYYSYFEGVDKELLHFEPLYFLLMDIFSFGYVSWRFAVWGLLGASSYVVLSKLLRLDKHISTIVCFTFALPIILYYQRAACGYCLLYIALAIYLDNPLCYGRGKRLLLYVLVSLASLLFHRAMPFYLILLVISILIPLNKKSFVFIIGGALLVNYSLLSYTDFFLDIMSDGTQETGLRYLENATVMNKNVAGILFEFINKIPVLFMVLFGIYKQLRCEIVLSKTEKVCLINTFLLLIIALMFRQTSFVIESKFYKASILPFSLFLASYFPKIRGTRVARLYIYGTALIFVLIAFYKVSHGVFFYTA